MSTPQLTAIRTANTSVQQSASAATLTLTNPFDFEAGPAPNCGLMLAVISIKSNATVTTATAGWTKLAQDNSGANFTQALFIAASNAANPVFTWTGAVACFGMIVPIQNPSSPLRVSGVGAASVTSGSGTTHTSTSINTTEPLSLAVYIDTSNVNTAMAQPTGWTEAIDLAAATAVGRVVVGSKDIAVEGDPSGAISVTGSSGNWVQRQIEVSLEPLTNDVAVNSTELVSIIEPEPGLAVSFVELVSIIEVAPIPPINDLGRRLILIN